MTDIEIGRAKRARRAYSFDDIAIVPSRRTRDPEEVSTAWQIDAYRFDIPVLAAPMDSVMSPTTAIALGNFGGLGVLNLEGLWTRYDDPDPLLEEVAGLQGVKVLNINELCNALKPVVLPGEGMRIFILKEGKEQGQGVAYLDDGTMIVVDEGKRFIGKNIDVIVTSVLQTTAGRMIFTRIREEHEESPHPVKS